jgi:hypothetical protein
MASKKQTAVQWLLDTMANSAGMEQPDIDRVFEQAKAMEKQQLIKSYMHVKEENEQVWLYDDLEREFANDYYKELYGKQDSN